MPRGCCVPDMPPATLCLRRNTYHVDLNLYILDVIRLFQDHPKFSRGLKECHIIDMLENETIACGDVEAQVKCVLRELTTIGYVRFLNSGYRTIGPFAKLAMARNARQQAVTWERLTDMLKNNSNAAAAAGNGNFNNSCGVSHASFNGGISNNFSCPNESLNGGGNGGGAAARFNGGGGGNGASSMNINSSASSQTYM